MGVSKRCVAGLTIYMDIHIRTYTYVHILQKGVSTNMYRHMWGVYRKKISYMLVPFYIYIEREKGKLSLEIFHMYSTFMYLTLALSTPIPKLIVATITGTSPLIQSCWIVVLSSAFNPVCVRAEQFSYTSKSQYKTVT